MVVGFEKTLIEQASKHTQAISRDIAEICMPLLAHTGIHSFVCIRFYPDGTRTYVSNHANWLDHYFSQQYFYHRSHNNTYGFKAPEKGLLFWTGFEYDEVFHSAYEHDIWNGVTMHEKEGDVHVAYLFGSTRDQPEMINFYLDHVDVLRRFIFYFKERSKSLLEKHHGKIVIPPGDNIIKPDHRILEGGFDKGSMIGSLPVNRYYVEGETYLTHREVECMKWAVQGKSAEEISMILGTAKRTIEIHLNNAKEKLGCCKITQLIQKAKALGLVE